MIWSNKDIILRAFEFGSLFQPQQHNNISAHTAQTEFSLIRCTANIHWLSWFHNYQITSKPKMVNDRPLRGVNLDGIRCTIVWTWRLWRPFISSISFFNESKWVHGEVLDEMIWYWVVHAVPFFPTRSLWIPYVMGYTWGNHWAEKECLLPLGLDYRGHFKSLLYWPVIAL